MKKKKPLPSPQSVQETAVMLALELHRIASNDRLKRQALSKLKRSMGGAVEFVRFLCREATAIESSADWERYDWYDSTTKAARNILNNSTSGDCYVLPT